MFCDLDCAASSPLRCRAGYARRSYDFANSFGWDRRLDRNTGALFPRLPIFLQVCLRVHLSAAKVVHGLGLVLGSVRRARELLAILSVLNYSIRYFK